MAKIRGEKCLANGFIWMGRPTEFTLEELKKINKTVKNTRKNWKKEDHIAMSDWYKKHVKKGERLKKDIKAEIMGKWGISATQLNRIIRKYK